MINKIGHINIRETILEETSEAKEEQPQANISSDVEPLVQATPEYKSGLIAERRLGSQAQEIFLRNQVIDLDEPADPSSPLAGKSVPEVVQETVQHVPEELNKMLGEMGEAWSDPGKAVSEMAKEAGRIWSDIKDGK